jgi:LysM repeat protein
MQCFACNREALQRCPRCGNAYCEGHGADFCAACLDPLNAAPSRSTFRIAMLGFLGGCVLALWLLVRPPSVPGESSPIVIDQSTPSPALTPAGAGGSATPVATGSNGSVTPVPTAATTPRPSSTGPAGSGTATPVPTPTPAPTAPPGPLQYVVVEGDTWFGIAEAFGVDAFTLAQFNGRTLEDTDYLHLGETILIPQ